MTLRNTPMSPFLSAAAFLYQGKGAEIDQCVNSQANYTAFNKAHLELSLERRSPMKQWYLFLGFKALLSRLWSFPPFVSLCCLTLTQSLMFSSTRKATLCSVLAIMLLSIRYQFLRSPQTQILSGPCL